jgi:hypothetical protein
MKAVQWTLKFMVGFTTGILILTSLVGCGTVGGAMQGASEDLNKAGGWVRSR